MWTVSKLISKQTVIRSAFMYVLLSAALGAEEVTYPRIPLQSLDRYEVMEYREVVETMTMKRIRIKGTKDIIFDPVPNMKKSDHKPGQVRYFNRSEPQLTFEILSFPSTAFPSELSAPTLARYLQGRAAHLAKKNFEIVEEPVVTTGPAKFRILGERALTLRYAFDTKQGRVIRGENWLEKDGMIHVVLVDAPPDLFNNHFKRVKAGLNSMTYVTR